MKNSPETFGVLVDNDNEINIQLLCSTAVASR